MSTPEAKAKAFIDEFMKKWYPGAFKYSPPGTGRFGKNGMPDRLWFIGVTEDLGITVAIEVKAPDGSLSDLQSATLHRMKKLGLVAATIHGKDITKAFAIKEEIDRRIKLIKEKFENG